MLIAPERDCRDCGEPMVLRTNRITEERFWGCTAYPECLYTEREDNEEIEGFDN